MSNLELRISNIVDAVNDELTGLNPNEQASAWVSAKELIDEHIQSLVFEAMQMDKELKPCTSCGGEANLQDDYSYRLNKKCWKVWHLCKDGSNSPYVNCGELGRIPIITPWCDSREEAIKAWNAQAEHSEQGA